MERDLNGDLEQSESFTFADQIATRGGRPIGFDYLRLTLALSVILLHESDIVYGPLGAHALWNSPLGPIFRLTVPMFFALSGFLVAEIPSRPSYPLAAIALSIPFNTVMSILVSTAIAAFSWTYIEKPFLGLKGALSVIERRMIDRRERKLLQKAAM